MSKVNITTGFALFNDDSNKIPVNQLSKAKGSGEEEERVLKEVSSEQIKTFLQSLYERHNGHMIAPASWSQVISEDEQLLAHVYALHSAEYEQKRAALEANSNVDISIFGAKLLNAKQHADDFRLRTLAQAMDHKEAKELSTILASTGFFSKFRIGRVQTLTKYVDELNAVTASNFKVFEILREGYGGLDNFAFFLSSSKLSPLTKEEAKAIQTDLLVWWRDDQRKSFNDVAVQLGFSTLWGKSLTYENMDTLIEYVALRDSLQYNQARPVALLHLRQLFGDVAVLFSILSGKEIVQTASSYLRGKYVDKRFALTSEEVNAFAKELEHDLRSQWLEHGFIISGGHHKVRNVPSEHKEHNVAAFEADIQAWYKAYSEEYFDLSLRPPVPYIHGERHR